VAFPPPAPPPLDTADRPGPARPHFPLVTRSVRDDGTGNGNLRRLRPRNPVSGWYAYCRLLGFPWCDRSWRKVDLVAIAEPLDGLVMDHCRALSRCQDLFISPWPHSHIHGVNPDRQLAAIVDEDRYQPQARLLARLLGSASPRADLAHLCSPPVLAKRPQLDEGERKGQPGKNRADRRNGRPAYEITVVELARPGPASREFGAVTGTRTDITSRRCSPRHALVPRAAMHPHR
jgi:hypothetical protein